MAARNDPTFDIRDQWAPLADQPAGRNDNTAGNTFATRERGGRALDLGVVIQTAIGDAHDIVAAIWEGDDDACA